MMYDKKEFERGGLIAILRNCGEAGVRACSECSLEPVYHGDVQCIGDLMTAAADRLEEYVDRCARFSEEVMVLREQRRWIPVEERLPEQEDCVVVCVSGKPRENITLCDTVELATYSGNEGWILECWPDWATADVTHWMPLPPAPEEVNNGKNG